MKPIRFLFMSTVICFVLLAFSVTAVAAEDIELVINGQKVKTDVPPALVSGRTMVPIRVISENLGATVSWDGLTKVVTVTSRDRIVVLQIGSLQGLINGEVKDLDSPAYMKNGRTLVPLRFIGEALGAVVGWKAESRTVTVENYEILGLDWNRLPEGARLTVSLTGPAGYKITELPGEGDVGAQILIDITPATFKSGTSYYPVDDGSLIRIRTGMQNTAPNQARIVMDLKAPVAYEVSRSEDGTKLHVDIRYQVNGIVYEGGTSGRTVVISTNGAPEFEAFSLPAPARIVVDIKNATLAEGVPPAVEVGRDGIKRIRASQFQSDPDVVRVVVDLEQSVGFKATATADAILVSFDPQVEKIEWQDTGSGTRVSLRTTMPVTWDESLENGKLFLNLHRTGVLPDVPGEIRVGSEQLDRVTVTSQEDENGRSTVIGFALPYHYGHSVTQAGENLLVVDFAPSPLAGVKIAVDAGHGGSDPGAIGKSGLKEKDVNLDIARSLIEMLRLAGADVLVIRDGDYGVELLRRPEMANDAMVDYFISIHSNSYPDPSKDGTETYYFPGKEDGRRLAETIQRNLLRSLGTTDRGVKSADFAVLRETKMTAVLAEIAFISNRADEQSLADPDFRRNAARAIYDGLVEYLTKPRV